MILLFISQSAFAYKWQNVDGGVFYVCGNNGVQKLQMIDHSDVKSVEFQQHTNAPISFQICLKKFLYFII
ncbi:MAG: hypothetical protein Q4B61_05190, partial [Bacteroidales bacterium]|nr:hypothetical protein [Bacteroidales bacterium]